MTKKNVPFILLGLFLTAFSSVLKAQQDVAVFIVTPPPNQWGVEDMWNLTLRNTTGSPLTVKLYGSVEEATDGLILDGTSATFDVAPDINRRILRQDVEPADVGYTNKEYEEIILRTRTLPAGTYTICVTVLEANSGAVLGKQCILQPIAHASPPELITPFNEAEVKDPFPVFLWLPPAPLRTGEFVNYTIKIVELYDEQVPIEAMDANPAFYTEKSILSTSFQLPVSASDFEPDHYYAWQVTAFINGYEAGFSQVWSFVYNKKETPPMLTCKDILCNPENWEFGTPTFTNVSPINNTISDNNTLYLTQPVQIRPRKISMLKAELINFEWHTVDTCKNCDPKYRYWGRISTGTGNDPDFSLKGVLPLDMAGNPVLFGHSLSWRTLIANDSANFNGNITLFVSLPPQTQKTGCKDTLCFSVRYVVEIIYNGSKTYCSTVRSYASQRDHIKLSPIATKPGDVSLPDSDKNNK
ncbi:MAG: hypothetical protein Q8M08_12550 [Bacteroidales bacterium]|nr:hypothetical protein [Bacteroidales bacterium]